MHGVTNIKRLLYDARCNKYKEILYDARCNKYKDLYLPYLVVFTQVAAGWCPE